MFKKINKNMLYKNLLAIFFLTASFCSCSQKIKIASCQDKIDSLYHLYNVHLIFCSYYYEKISNNTGADTIYPFLTFYRNSGGIADTLEKDRKIISNLKKYFCSYDESKIRDIDRWCKISISLKKIREETEFTLDGYMSFLLSNRKTKPLIESYIIGERTIDSFSTDEMENIYFRSIEFIVSMTEEQQKHFFESLVKWDFSK